MGVVSRPAKEEGWGSEVLRWLSLTKRRDEEGRLPAARADDTLDGLRHTQYFSSMNLNSGYWQIEVDERNRDKRAFVTPDGLYEFEVMPFGVCTATATLQRVMNTVLAGLK